MGKRSIPYLRFQGPLRTNKVPLNKYFSGGGEKVMANMKKEYGMDKAKKVFYATSNKRKKKKGRLEKELARS